MEFFGISLYGPQNYIKDILIDDYKEPTTEEDANALMKRVIQNSTTPKKVNLLIVVKKLNLVTIIKYNFLG